jgi:hypothetical protein
MSVSYIEDEVRQLLVNTPAVFALVPGNQIYPAFIRSDAVFPCISITCVGSSRTRQLDNTLDIMKRLQIDVFSSSFSVVKNLELIIADLLDGFTGTFVDDSFRVISCQAETVLDSWGQDSSTFRVMMQFELVYT